MSLVSLVNLADRLLNQDSAHGQDAPVSQHSSTPQAGQEPQSVAEDQFTPSAQNGQAQTSAQAAGLFSVTQFSFFSAAADFLLGRNTAPRTNQNVGAVPATLAAAPAPQALSVAAAANAPAPAALLTTDSALTQQQLQPLNQALASLGLSQQDIQKLDQIAAIINDFNPPAFTALAYQLEELAQQQTPQPASATTGGIAATNAAPSPAGVANAATSNPATNGTTANPGGFQVQELIIKFSGVNEQRAIQPSGSANGTFQASTGSTNGSFQASAFKLQIEEVNLTLVNNNGQTAQIQALSQRATPSGLTANPAPSNPKSQTAGA